MPKPLTRKAMLFLKTKELEKEKKNLRNSLYYTYVGEAAKKLEKVGLVKNAHDLRSSIVERLQKRQQEDDENAEGNRMIREIQAQQKRQQEHDENAEGNRMIREIQTQQKLARTRIKPPRRRPLMKKRDDSIGKVYRGYNSFLNRHLEKKYLKDDNSNTRRIIANKTNKTNKTNKRIPYN
jgi:hypothetical protein